METQVEISVEQKQLHELLKSKRCSKHQRKDKKSKRAKQKAQLRKEMKGDESPLSLFPALNLFILL